MHERENDSVGQLRQLTGICDKETSCYHEGRKGCARKFQFRV
jgi:hypothetical protein